MLENLKNYKKNILETVLYQIKKKELKMLTTIKTNFRVFGKGWISNRFRKPFFGQPCLCFTTFLFST